MLSWKSSLFLKAGGYRGEEFILPYRREGQDSGEGAWRGADEADFLR